MCCLDAIYMQNDSFLRSLEEENLYHQRPLSDLLLLSPSSHSHIFCYSEDSSSYKSQIVKADERPHRKELFRDMKNGKEIYS